MFNIVDNSDYFFNLNYLNKFEKGKCCLKIDRGNDSGIVDTYSTLCDSFLSSGGIITDNEYCVDCTFDYDGFYDD